MKGSLLPSAFILLAGCGTTISYVETNRPPHTMYSRQPREVEVFSTTPPKRPYVEVGLLEARQESTWSVDRNVDVIAKLREGAAERGCDAVFMTGSADEVVGSSSQQGGSVKTLKGYKASCLVWTGPEPKQHPSSSATPTPVVAPPSCVPGESRACVGPGGCSGGQACAADGKHYEPCDCGGQK